MTVAMNLKIDARGPIPIRRQLAEQLKHLIESDGVPPDQPLPSIRELAGFLGINTNTVARVVEDLKRSGYVEARRGKGVFVTASPPARPSPHLRERFLRETVIRAAALGLTADELAVGVLSVAGIRPEAIQESAEVLLVECSLAELDFFAAQLETYLPVRVHKVLLDELGTVIRREPTGRWRAAVTSFCHLPTVERLLSGVPVIALLAEARLGTLHRLAQLPTGTRVGVAAAAVETAHNLEHSIASAALPNIVLVGACLAESAAIGRLLRRVDVVVCPSSTTERVKKLAESSVQVLIDDRTLDPRAIEMLAGVLVREHGDRAPGTPPVASRPPASRPSRRHRRQSATTRTRVPLAVEHPRDGTRPLGGAAARQRDGAAARRMGRPR